MKLYDATGSSRGAKVNAFGQVFTKGVDTTLENFGATLGYTYNVNTDNISLTTGSKSAVLYIKNNDANDVYISAIGYLLGNSTGGSGDLKVEVLSNPTAGTIVSGAVDAPIIANKNFGTKRTLNCDIYKGAEGNAFTDGDLAYSSLLNSAGKQYTIATGRVVLERGQSLGVNITPQSGNTSMDVQVFLAVLDANGFDS